MSCDERQLIQRPPRTSAEHARQLVFHQGRIATGNQVVQDGKARDEISARCGGALCVKMEAAGVDVNRRCLVVRGISDYADSHKSDLWRHHAAGNAAAFTKELLCRVQPVVAKPTQAVSKG
jgi:nucleoside phosphorylase